MRPGNPVLLMRQVLTVVGPLVEAGVIDAAATPIAVSPRGTPPSGIGGSRSGVWCSPLRTDPGLSRPAIRDGERVRRVIRS
jgi:hypothetical protein